MLAYLQDIWKCRYFWLSLVHMDLRTRYRGSVIGMGWSLLQPICMTVILCLVFAKLMCMPIRDFAPYLMTGLAFWSFIQSVTAHGCYCFFFGQAYIRQFPAPMAIYPLRSALGGAFHFVLAMSLVVALALVLRGIPSWLALLALVPAFVMLLALGWALALLFGLATVRFRDTNHLTEIGLQGMFYLTPIFYPAEVLTQRGLGFLLNFNPFMPFLTLLRTPILDGQWPTAAVWAAAGGVLLVTGTAAALAMRQQERQLIFHL
jgi:ABC-type polysaccharide/polyol phosphate export permease